MKDSDGFAPTARDLVRRGRLPVACLTLLDGGGLGDRDLGGLTLEELAALRGAAPGVAAALIETLGVLSFRERLGGGAVRGGRAAMMAVPPPAVRPASHSGCVEGQSTVQAGSVHVAEMCGTGLLSVRTSNALLTHGLRTVADVRRLGPDLGRLRNIGRGAIEELVRAGVLVDGEISDTTESVTLDDSADQGIDQESRDGSGPHESKTFGIGVDLAGDSDAFTELGDWPAPAAAPSVPPLTLAGLLPLAHAVVTSDDYDLLVRRGCETLEHIAQRRAVTRERVRQLELRAERRLRPLHSPAARMVGHWRDALERGITSEADLFAVFLDPGGDVAEQLELGRILLRTFVDGVRRARAFGQMVLGHWMMRGDPAIEGQLRQFAEFGPYANEEWEESLVSFGLDPTLAVTLLTVEGAPLIHDSRARGWVRRIATVRDACYIVLNRVGRPARGEVLARLLGVETARNVAANLERDDRFRRLYALRVWALASWGDLGDGTRYRSTRDAVVDILTREGPLELQTLVDRVHRAHPVTSWAVSNTLEDEAFGLLPDGRWGMAYQGGRPHEDGEPARSDDVDPPIGSRIGFFVPVTKDLLRGSGLGVPQYVTWFVGLRRVPRERTFVDAEDAGITLRRRPGCSGVSSLRHFAQRHHLTEGCLLHVLLDRGTGSAEIAPACPCHAAP